VRVAGMRAAGVPAGTAPRTSEERQAADMRGVDMSMNMPPQPPLLRQLLREGLTAQLHETALADLMTYRAGPGTGRDRAMAAAWLAPVMGEVDPGRILVCGGAQSALTGLLTMLAKPGDVILTEALTYPGFRAVAAQLGIRLIGVPTDDEGPLPEALEQACRAARPKAFYCGPTIQNPTTVTTSLARRQAVAEIALRHGISIIEDDAYGMLPEAPLAAIATLAPAACFYIGTVAKCLSPGLRCAYVVAPDRPLAGRLAGAIRATSLSPSPLLTGLVTRWIGDGSAIRLRDAVRDEARARQVMARTILPADAIAAHPDGLHLWLTLPAHWNRLDFSAHLRGRGLTLVPSDAFLVEGQAPNAVRMSLGVAETQEALREALLAVAAAMTADAPSNYAEIV
jgi:DNA-binding transcriptional MocR family regulator